MFETKDISPEDYSAYGLQSIFDKHLNEWEQRLYGRRKSWVCDKERDIRLLYVRREMLGGPSGRDEPTGRFLFVVFLKGIPFEVTLKMEGEEGFHIGTQKIVQYWKLERITDPNGGHVPEESFREFLQDALSADQARRWPDVADARAVLI